ncbi:hypothetical protein HanIR_Chr01g0006191 [Helianthus annuus]|nr:hypothetical protein HanIR_Chr01g0006191 [Helianthus annuus]
MRPSLSEREKGAKGTLRGWLGRMGTEESVDSGGPQPSGLKGTSPISKPTMLVFLTMTDRSRVWRMETLFKTLASSVSVANGKLPFHPLVRFITLLILPQFTCYVFSFYFYGKVTLHTR